MATGYTTGLCNLVPAIKESTISLCKLAQLNKIIGNNRVINRDAVSKQIPEQGDTGENRSLEKRPHVVRICT